MHKPKPIQRAGTLTELGKPDLREFLTQEQKELESRAASSASPKRTKPKKRASWLDELK